MRYRRDRTKGPLWLLTLLLRQDAAPDGALCGAAKARRKSPKDGAQDARQFAVCTWTYTQRTPQCLRAPAGQDARRARHPGCVSLVTPFAQAKRVTRSAAGREEAVARRNPNPTETSWFPFRVGVAEKCSPQSRCHDVTRPSPCAPRHPAPVGEGKTLGFHQNKEPQARNRSTARATRTS